MRFSPSLLVSAAILGVLLAHGCATVSSSVMVPQGLRLASTLGGSVRVEAKGSSKRAYIVRPLVRDEALAGALRTSLIDSGLFDEVVEGHADRVLEVRVESIEEPELGLDQTCTVAISWRLLDGNEPGVLWEDHISTRHTVHSFEEVDSEERGRMAIAGALRKNLLTGLERLSRAG